MARKEHTPFSHKDTTLVHDGSTALTYIPLLNNSKTPFNSNYQLKH